MAVTTEQQHAYAIGGPFSRIPGGGPPIAFPDRGSRRVRRPFCGAGQFPLPEGALRGAEERGKAG